jgi:hypothetical protein
VAFWVGAHELSQTFEPVAHQLRLTQLLGHRPNPLVCRPELGVSRSTLASLSAIKHPTLPESLYTLLGILVAN